MKQVSVDLSEKQLGTIIAYMIIGIVEREQVKDAACKAKIKHLDNMDDECKMLLKFTELYKQFISK